MSEHTNASPTSQDEFYVGYLPVPNGHRKFIALLVSTLLIWSLSLAIIITITMRSPGEATWDTGEIQSWSGTLVESPYPMLIPDNIDQSPPLFVVSMGKSGAHERLKPFFGQHVSVQGYELNRDNRHIIELAPDQDAIKTDDTVPARSAPTILTSTPVDLIGEIVDGKCYLGAMKPGDGTGHRACATLCIQGGLPPMFATKSASGERTFYLLTIDGTTDYSPQMLALVGRPVRISGQLTDFTGTPVLQASSADISRTR